MCQVFVAMVIRLQNREEIRGGGSNRQLMVLKAGLDDEARGK